MFSPVRRSRVMSRQQPMTRPKRERQGSPPRSVIQALLNPALNEIWLHLLQPVPDERTGGDPPADPARPADYKEGR